MRGVYKHINCSPETEGIQPVTEPAKDGAWGTNPPTGDFSKNEAARRLYLEYFLKIGIQPLLGYRPNVITCGGTWPMKAEGKAMKAVRRLVAMRGAQSVNAVNSDNRFWERWIGGWAGQRA